MFNTVIPMFAHDVRAMIDGHGHEPQEGRDDAEREHRGRGGLAAPVGAEHHQAAGHQPDQRWPAGAWCLTITPKSSPCATSTSDAGERRRSAAGPAHSAASATPARRTPVMNAAGTSRSPICGPRRSRSAPDLDRRGLLPAGTADALAADDHGPRASRAPGGRTAGPASTSSDKRPGGRSSRDGGHRPRFRRTRRPARSGRCRQPIEPAKCSAAASRSSSEARARRPPRPQRARHLAYRRTPCVASSRLRVGRRRRPGSSTSPRSRLRGRLAQDARRSARAHRCRTTVVFGRRLRRRPPRTSRRHRRRGAPRSPRCSVRTHLHVAPRGARAADSSGSSQSTSRIGAKNLSRSSKRSSPSRLSLAI